MLSHFRVLGSPATLLTRSRCARTGQLCYCMLFMGTGALSVPNWVPPVVAAAPVTWLCICRVAKGAGRCQPVMKKAEAHMTQRYGALALSASLRAVTLPLHARARVSRPAPGRGHMEPCTGSTSSAVCQTKAKRTGPS